MTHDHVSLEQAQALQKAGWKGETEYVYKVVSKKGSLIGEYVLSNNKKVGAIYESNEIYLAPSTSQLAEGLLKLSRKSNQQFFIKPHGDNFLVETFDLEAGNPQRYIDTLPDALSKATVYLITNGFMK